jgi:hypothetical protein
MTFTIDEIRNYLISVSSFGDALYFLTEENIRKANEKNVDSEEEVDVEDINYWIP